MTTKLQALIDTAAQRISFTPPLRGPRRAAATQLDMADWHRLVAFAERLACRPSDIIRAVVVDALDRQGE